MDMHPVTSSMLSHLGYDPETHVLLAQFVHTPVDRYADVLPEMVQALRKAPSLGGFFAQHIMPYYTAEKQHKENDGG